MFQFKQFGCVAAYSVRSVMEDFCQDHVTFVNK